MKYGLKGCLLGIFISTSAMALTNAAESYDSALTAFNQGEVQESYLLLKQVLKDNPDHLPSKLLMGKILLIDGYVNEAIEEFEEVLLAGGDVNLVMPVLSRAYLFSGQYNKIFAMLNRNSLSSEAELAVSLVAGTAYNRLNRKNDAISLYRSVLSKSPDSIEANNALATQLIELHQLDEARTLITHSEDLQPGNPFTLLTKAKLVTEEGQNSLPIYRKAFEIAPDNPATMRGYAGALAENGDYQQASELVEKIEAQTPGDVQNQLLKARILALTQNQHEADKILKQLTERLSLLSDEQLNERIELSLITGIVGYLNKNFDIASSELTRYMSQREMTPEQLGMLADALLRIGAYKEAAKILEKNEAIVIQNLPLATLNCELFITLNRRFKCEQILPELKKRYGNQEAYYILKAKVLLDAGKFEEAQHLLAKDLSASEAEEVLRLNTMLLSNQQKFAEALPIAKKLSAKYPKNVDYQALLADLLIRTDDIDAANRIVADILAKHPDSVAGQVAKARIAFARKDSEKARIAIETAVKLDKNNIPARLLAAQIYINSNRNDAALEHLLAAKTLAKEDVRPRELLISIYRKEGNSKAALSEINALLGIDRLSPEYHLEKASILMDVKDLAGAKKQLDIVYSLWLDEPQKLLALTSYQVRAADVAGAKKSYLSAINAAPKAVQPKQEFIAFLIAQDELDQAETLIKEVVEQFGDSANLWLLQGDLANARGSLEQASSFYAQAIKLAPEFTLPLIKSYELAKRGIGKERFINYLNQSRENGNDEDKAFKSHLLADIYYLDKSYDKASPLYLALLKKDNVPNKESILNNLANIYASSDVEKAQRYIETALQKAPNSAPLLDTKGWLLSLSGDYLAGLGVLRQAYTLDSSNPSIHYHIAYTLDKLGRAEEARQVLVKHGTLRMTFSELNEAKSLAEKLKI